VPPELVVPVSVPPALVLPPAAAPPVAPPRTDQGPRPRTPAPPEQFSVKCPVCDTLVYATLDEVGSTKTCPDCYSPVTIPRPRKKPRRVNEVVETEYDGMLFKLSDPVPLPSYASGSTGVTTNTEGEAALRRAEREYDEKKVEEPDPILAPFWTGLLQFARDPAVMARGVVGAGLLASIGKLLMATILWAGTPGVTWFYALAGSVAVLVLTVLTAAFLGSTCLTVAEETSYGHLRVRHWPAANPLDWAIESLPFASALFSSALPGLAVFGFAGALGMPASSRWLFLLVSVYLFLPVVQASLLESGTLTQLLSRPILHSVRSDFLPWATFYLITFALLWLVAVTLALVHPDLATSWWLVLGGVWTAVLLGYYRLLGRLAWACQIRAAAQEDEAA
jgi:hypothetical protein